MNGSPNSNKKFKNIPKRKKQDSKSQRFKDSELQGAKATKSQESSREILPDEKQPTKKSSSFSHIVFQSLGIAGKYIARLARFDYFLTFFTMGAVVLIVFIAFLAYKVIQNQVLPFTDTYHIHPIPEYTPTASFTIQAQAYIVYEVSSRSVVYGKNIRYRFSPASTAKIMTALLSIEHYSLNTILVANHPELVEGSKMNLINGEHITVQNLLYGLLLPSGNDAAHVLADHYPGGLSGFLAAMNQKAQELKMDNTYYNDPAGYNDDNYTTPFDLARLAAIAIQNPTFAKIVATKSITVTGTDGKIIHQLDNLNELLNQKEVTGIKTGFTNEAGEVLVTSAVHDGHTYIIVVMKSPDRFGDSLTLLRSVVDHVQLVTY